MIKFNTLDKSEPYKKFQDLYLQAFSKDQKNIEAVCISSYNKKNLEVSSRFVNLKYIRDNKFFFYSNYNSPKAIDFLDHNQIAVNIFWSEINIQIRIKAKIFKAKSDESDSYFNNRSKQKNALAISSDQSKMIKNYNEVEKNYANTFELIKDKSILDRPDYWGGYYFVPYYFEFWEGHPNRLNIRHEFILSKEFWNKKILQP
tara:strand:- start:537 stop:1142 length:606 start_codon:yes stop_codon:yes gene_type:complete